MDLQKDTIEDFGVENVTIETGATHLVDVDGEGADLATERGKGALIQWLDNDTTITSPFLIKGRPGSDTIH